MECSFSIEIRRCCCDSRSSRRDRTWVSISNLKEPLPSFDNIVRTRFSVSDCCLSLNPTSSFRASNWRFSSWRALLVWSSCSNWSTIILV